MEIMTVFETSPACHWSDSRPQTHAIQCTSGHPLL